ncbi:inositol-3-phosphate synthase-like [Hibiscus syriacus]|uniref:Inositol-3-phosphate synthase-like n=2 Tax=Hibiscus syriacus TaxID=106335 RepID=A0A6A2YGT9_HIBSY|nr:inositol-3-phosphate synthase-like [Hibiscus syriacus]
MLLGKRIHHPIKRTTSMTGITVDVVSNVDGSFVVQEPNISDYPQNHPFHELPNANSGYDQRLLSMVSPRNPGGGGRRSAFTSNHDLDGTAPFLRSCCLCKRRLAPGRDIYMYRGDTAFCSLECREQQMKQDERREKSNLLPSKKKDRHAYAYS